MKKVDKKAFTLIELIVVIAVVGILVLLAAPKFIGQTDKAKAAQIQNDIRSAETIVMEWLATEDDMVTDWDYDDEVPEDGTLLDKQLQDNLGVGGPLENISDVLKGEINSSLTGEFYSDEEGNVYYWSNKYLSIPNVDNDKEDKLTYEDWLQKKKADGYVMAEDADFEYIQDPSNNKWYYRYIGSEEYIIIPNEIDGNKITEYYKMFAEGASPVKGVAAYNPNITSMSNMFMDSSSTELELDLNTENVTSMLSMFYNTNLKSLDLSSFDTRNVTNMRYMFYDVETEELDLRSFDTRNVTDMRYMFSSSKIPELDLSSFNTSNVTNFDYMLEDVNPETTIYVRTNDDKKNMQRARGTLSSINFIIK